MVQIFIAAFTLYFKIFIESYCCLLHVTYHEYSHPWNFYSMHCHVIWYMWTIYIEFLDIDEKYLDASGIENIYCKCNVHKNYPYYFLSNIDRSKGMFLCICLSLLLTVCIQIYLWKQLSIFEQLGLLCCIKIKEKLIIASWN